MKETEKTALEFRPARPEETEAVVGFYTEVIEQMQVSPYHPTWIMGIYPTADFLSEAVRRQEIYLAQLHGETVGAMLLNHACNENYGGLHWGREAPAAEVLILHLLCVLPKHWGKGCAKEMLRFLLRHAAETGQKAVRFDAMEGNLPARQLYERMGFTCVDTVQMYYESTGWTGFSLYY